MIELIHASFQYENSDRGVQDISLSVKSGECVVLTGLSGCGKTTVTRLVNGLAPSYYPGVFSGSVRIDGKDISRLSTWEIGRLVGSVFQDPKSQFFSSELAGEVAFPCENYGLSAREIRERTDAAIEALHLSHLKDRAVDVLSSGEKQRAAIASVYAMKPKVFVCDEPTANLDAAGTKQLAQTLRQLKEQGFTLLLAEHRIDWLMGIADRFLYLRDGRIAAEYTPEDLLLLPEADILGMGLRSPHEGKCLPAPSVLDESPAVLKTAGLSKRIRKEVIFEDISLSVPEGGVTAITGQNGAGKTTLAQILCGLARQTRGHILIDGKKARAAVRRREIYYCGNDTSTQFFTASVAEELLLNTRLTEESKSHARNLLNELGLYEYRDAHPSTLSGGQKQRLAIACAIFSGRRILILDEPTSGLDGQNMRLIAERLKSEARNGRTILVITHDRELIESCCDRIAKIGVKFGRGDVA
ncbi:MAG: ABC transporter ATP-binding protein [Oscillospiraceae bacterium]